MMTLPMTIDAGENMINISSVITRLMFSKTRKPQSLALLESYLDTWNWLEVRSSQNGMNQQGNSFTNNAKILSRKEIWFNAAKFNFGKGKWKYLRMWLYPNKNSRTMHSLQSWVLNVTYSESKCDVFEMNAPNMGNSGLLWAKKCRSFQPHIYLTYITHIY